jgi:hypothetical protein
MESEAAYSGNPIEFEPAPISFIEIWNYPVRRVQLFQKLF